MSLRFTSALNIFQDVYKQVVNYVVGGGTTGLLVANHLSEDPNISAAVVEAGSDAGKDPKVATSGLWRALLGSGHSWSFAAARPNLPVLSKTGTQIILHAKKEIIIFTEFFNSVKILKLFGTGDPEILQTKGIDVKVASPYVGSNLQDHGLGGIRFEAADGVPTIINLIRINLEALQTAINLYEFLKTSPFATPAITSVAYLPVVSFIENSGEEMELKPPFATSKMRICWMMRTASFLIRYSEIRTKELRNIWFLVAQSAFAKKMPQLAWVQTLNPETSSLSSRLYRIPSPQSLLISLPMMPLRHPRLTINIPKSSRPRVSRKKNPLY
ncbi:hypothetical protein CC78DRAFT_547562 [Lojkania enalia]|uniref:Glucose-methanol-choline oxidoreductase N-terminal domain-containing protein n=1 Tax=Lojkania enalia TaxID=147567 RepID=A0A9P4N695_9PLEO|nr:hypothetical protein CC78DRAFT_547562 [Didymosphaeria enalia]